AELFLTPNWDRVFQPFLDVRAHMFIDGRFASNQGIGMRFLPKSKQIAYGVNFYHDYRQTSNLNVHQLGLGFDLLSHYVDFRANAYVPVANDKKTYSPEFYRFCGNSIEYKRRVKIAMPSANVELGAPIPGTFCRNFDLYVAGGAYYLFGKTVSQVSFDDALGVKGRISAKIFDMLGLEFAISYDSVYRRRAQGMASISFPLGRKKICMKKETCKERAFVERSKGRPERSEIIPTKTNSTKFLLCDQSGKACRVVFVNNQRSDAGKGTFAEPFRTLSNFEAKPSDVIYVFDGDGTSNGYDQGFVLSDGQRLQGSSESFLVQGIEIPKTTQNGPKITNSDAPVVTLANDSTVSGFTLMQLDGQPSIYGKDVANISIEKNRFIGDGLSAIHLEGLMGESEIKENVFEQLSNQESVIVAKGANNHAINIETNTFLGSSGIFPTISINGITAYIKGNSFNNTSSDVSIGDIAIDQASFVIENNTFMSSFKRNIHVDSAAYGVVANNRIIRMNLPPDAKSALMLRDVEKLSIVNNSITIMGAFTDVHGIQVESVGDLSIKNNTILTGNAFGIFLDRPKSVDISGNTAPYYIFTEDAINPIKFKQAEDAIETLNVSGIRGFYYSSP
ncbi:MAG: right-handed parallel beta-helix repeat-containing protein, partial [Simkaniaceae bacterium]|nr:right-handed parallel beta-helix repeat-containing protein [Simkaniaceae bacterium]